MRKFLIYVFTAGLLCSCAWRNYLTPSDKTKKRQPSGMVNLFLKVGNKLKESDLKDGGFIALKDPVDLPENRDLPGGDLRNLNLKEVDFENADLREVDMRGC